ncbi:hypothetical protein LCGC14_1106490 [marine sediment metagenome]|uniref:Uncharacterized protein n=1 Tax=marine sediment metagenome TaxID=412755 RepID=A0A0F9MVV7_9ZZZZ
MVKWISHNQGMFVGLILVSILMLWTYGCLSKVKSPISNQMVTRAELTLEVDVQVKQIEAQLDSLHKQASLQYESLDRQDVIKRKLFEFASLTAANNVINPMGIITLAGTLLGFGIAIDNRIKDKVIKNRPVNNKLPTTETT